MSKSVCSSKEVENIITDWAASCFNCKSNRCPCNMANHFSNREKIILTGSLSDSYFAILTAEMHHSWIMFGKMFNSNHFTKERSLLLRWNLSFYVYILIYLEDNFSTPLTTAIWIEARFTWSTHRPRCTCKFFRLLIKDGYTYMCRTLQCLYMKLNGGSLVHRWRTHQYLKVIRNTRFYFVTKKSFMFWVSLVFV